MRTTDTFRQYIWLINTIQRLRRISYDNIKKLWIENDINDGIPLSRTTFYRLRQAIEDIFGICIECDSQHHYYISNLETLRDNSTQNWMLRTLTVNSILIDGLTIKERILLEEIPSGTEYLQTIISAMKCHHSLEIDYKKFDDLEGYTIPVEPYCLKVFRQRWYLLGKCPTKDNRMSIFALDRISRLNETENTFEWDGGFDAEVFFRNCFGVFIGDETPPQRIVLRAHNKMVSFLRTLPLHHSQKEIFTTIDYSDFEYYLAPTRDFRQAILKEGDELEVISPEPLKEEIVKEITSAINRYRK